LSGGGHNGNGDAPADGAAQTIALQDDLFGDAVAPAPADRSEAPARDAPPAARRSRIQEVLPVAVPPDQQALAARLPPHVRIGTSSWSYPGWDGLLWDGQYSESILAKRGLATYARHPLMRTVSVDRAFHQPLTVSQYAAYAAQVPSDFRFVVKAPSVVADALVRSEDGRGMRSNPAFLDGTLALRSFIEPALEGLGDKTGALVFQLSPLPGAMLMDMAGPLDALARMLAALPSPAQMRAVAPDMVIAVEVRNAEWLTPAFANVLRNAGATYCLGLHAKLPAIHAQLPLLRALWPGPLVCRWNLHGRHGAYGYEEAKSLYEPFDKLVDPDPDTRAALAKVAAATAAAGERVYLTIGNKAEGSAPQTVVAMAEQIASGLAPC